MFWVSEYLGNLLKVMYYLFLCEHVNTPTW